MTTETLPQGSESPRGKRTWLGPRALKVAFAVTTSCLAAAAVASCASVPDSERKTIFAYPDGASLEPDYAIYRNSVNPILERQCGTFDCHGQPGRAYRVYSFQGLRVFNPEAGLKSGITETTEDEIRYNFQSFITVQPEEMMRVMARGGDNPDVLVVLSKPLGNERHKGGNVIARNGSAYKCIAAWLRSPIGGTLDAESAKQCKLALEVR
ncbi:MAG: hypothetical protein U0183_13320 [Polyangiaceae bacterium]|jgi:hypothetical protein